MKTALKLLAAVVLAAVAVTLARYHHVDPCKALEREIVRQVEHDVRTGTDSVQQVLADIGVSDSATAAVEGVASAVGNIATGVAQGVAKTKVEHMSRRQCVVELWRMAREE